MNYTLNKINTIGDNDNYNLSPVIDVFGFKCVVGMHKILCFAIESFLGNIEYGENVKSAHTPKKHVGFVIEPNYYSSYLFPNSNRLSLTSKGCYKMIKKIYEE